MGPDAVWPALESLLQMKHRRHRSNATLGWFAGWRRKQAKQALLRLWGIFNRPPEEAIRRG